MKILLITDTHSIAGGAERYFFELKLRLSRLPEHVVLSLGFADKAYVDDNSIVLKKIRSKMLRTLSQIFFNPWMYFKLSKLIKNFQPDVIHLHNFKQHSASLLKAIKPYPVVQTVHDYSVICPSAHNIHRDHSVCSTGWRTQCFWQHRIKYNYIIYVTQVLAFLKNRTQLKKSVNQFLAPSPLLVDFLMKNGFQNVKCCTPFISKHSPTTFEKMHAHHFLFAGNLGVHKGVYLLIDEFALAIQHNAALKLYIIGQGDEAKKLAQQVREHQLEQHIIFLGWQKDLRPYYESCACLIFPSLVIESFGLVVTEAMSCARPIIASNRGPALDLIEEGKTGLFFDPAKRGDLAEKILMLAGDVKRIEELGKNGHKKLLAMQSNESILENMLATYKKVASLNTP